jgi:enterochelin esterase family protein
MRNRDRFAHIGGFSGTMNGLSAAPLDAATFANGVDAASNKQLKLLSIGIGTAQPNPFPGAIRAFRKAGVKHVYFSSPGTAHEWLTWREACINSRRLCFAIEQFDE